MEKEYTTNRYESPRTTVMEIYFKTMILAGSTEGDIEDTDPEDGSWK
jgi:hypothetical protein